MRAKAMSLSVILPTYNHAKYLPACLDAILGQDRPPDEIIVIDDASTDETPALLQKYPNLRVVRNESNLGPAVGMNRVLESAKGSYLAFSAADDYILPGFFNAALSLLERHPKIALCTGDHLEFSGIGPKETKPIKTLNRSTEGVYTPETVRSLFRTTHLVIPTHATIYRKSAVIRAGGFIPELRNLCDWFLNIQCALDGGMAYIPSIFAAMRMLPGSYGSSVNANRALRAQVLSHLFRILDKPENETLKHEFKNCYLFSHFDYRFFVDFLFDPKRWPLTLPSFPHKIRRIIQKRNCSR